MELPLFHVTMPPLEKEGPATASATHSQGLDPPATRSQDPGSARGSSQTHWRHHCSRDVPIPDQLQESSHSLSHAWGKITFLMWFSFFVCLNNWTLLLDKVFCMSFILSYGLRVGVMQKMPSTLFYVTTSLALKLLEASIASFIVLQRFPRAICIRI